MRADLPPAGTPTVTRRADRGLPSSRPAGHSPSVAAPVKGARKLASLRDGASATLDCSRLPPGNRRLSGRKAAARPLAQAQLDTLDRATVHDADALLLDLIPLPADTTALHPEHIQAALYQAFDIQALYKDDMNQITFFATITTSTPQAVAAILTDTGHDPTTSARQPAATPVYPLAQPPICEKAHRDHGTGRWPPVPMSRSHPGFRDGRVPMAHSRHDQTTASHAR